MINIKRFFENHLANREISAEELRQFAEDHLGKLKALDSKTWTNLCLAGKWLVARNDREAVCYELPVK